MAAVGKTDESGKGLRRHLRRMDDNSNICADRQSTSVAVQTSPYTSKSTPGKKSISVMCVRCIEELSSSGEALGRDRRVVDALPLFGRLNVRSALKRTKGRGC